MTGIISTAFPNLPSKDSVLKLLFELDGTKKPAQLIFLQQGKILK